MPDMIRDGKGSGTLVEVNAENQLVTAAITASVEHHVNHAHGKAYNMVFDVTPTGAGDCFLYIKNTDSLDLIIEGIWIRVASAEQITMYLAQTGTPSGGADTPPSNLNAGSANLALGTYETGADITGLSGGRIVNKGWVANTTSAHFNFEQDLIIPQNTTYALYATTGAVNIAGAIVMNFHSNELGG